MPFDKLSIGKPTSYGPTNRTSNRPKPSRSLSLKSPPREQLMQRDDRRAVRIAESAMVRRKSLRAGEAVREQVMVGSVEPGLVHTRIRPPAPNQPSIAPLGSPARTIQDNMNRGATYDRLHIPGGAKSGQVVGGVPPNGYVDPSTTDFSRHGVSRPTGVVNGSYFVHNTIQKDNDGRSNLGLYRPVGPTITHDNPVAIPKPYKKDYVGVYQGDRVGMSAAPYLIEDGREKFNPHHRRFDYQVPKHLLSRSEKFNPKIDYAGHQAHCNDRNERAAMSIDTATGDLRMHTLTADNQRNQGNAMRMEQWRNIQNADRNPSLRAVNLDGGPSTFMGVAYPDGQVRTISQGHDESSRSAKPVSNVILSRPIYD